MDDFFFAEQCFYPSCDFVVFGKCDGNLAIDYVSMTATRCVVAIVTNGLDDDD